MLCMNYKRFSLKEIEAIDRRTLDTWSSAMNMMIAQVPFDVDKCKVIVEGFYDAC